MAKLERFAVECLHKQKYVSEYFDYRSRKAAVKFDDKRLFNADVFTVIAQEICPQITKDVQTIRKDSGQATYVEQVLQLLAEHDLPVGNLRPLDIAENNVQKISLFVGQVFKPTLGLFKTDKKVPELADLERAVLLQMQHQLTVLDNQ